MIVVGRQVGDTTLNGFEFLMHEDDATVLKEFETVREAKDFLLSVLEDGVTDEDLEDSFSFIDRNDIETVKQSGEE